MELFATADTLADLRDQKKKAEDALKEINEMISQTEEQLVAAMVEEEMKFYGTFCLAVRSPVEERGAQLNRACS